MLFCTFGSFILFFLYRMMIFYCCNSIKSKINPKEKNKKRCGGVASLPLHGRNCHSQLKEKRTQGNGNHWRKRRNRTSRKTSKPSCESDPPWVTLPFLPRRRRRVVAPRTPTNPAYHYPLTPRLSDPPFVLRATHHAMPTSRPPPLVSISSPFHLLR